MIRMVSFIHSPSGITLFSKIFNKFCEKISEDSISELIGCFLTALKTFSQEFGQDEIKQIEMSTLRFLISEKNEVMIFFLLNNDDIVEKYNKMLIICLNSFLKMFLKNIKKDFHNVIQFREFNPILHEILKITPEKIEPSCLTCPMGRKKECLFKQVKLKISDFKKKHNISSNNHI